MGQLTEFSGLWDNECYLVPIRFTISLLIWIVEKKIEGQSYEKISTLYKEEKTNIDSLSCEAIQTCLKRSSLSLEWIKGSTCGNIPLLSEVDVLTLKQNIINNAFEGCKFFKSSEFQIGTEVSN